MSIEVTPYSAPVVFVLTARPPTARGLAAIGNFFEKKPGTQVPSLLAPAGCLSILIARPVVDGSLVTLCTTSCVAPRPMRWITAGKIVSL